MRSRNVILVAALCALAVAGRALADTVYFVGEHYGSTNNVFGTVDSAGHTTTIATGLTFGGSYAEKLIFAPDGQLYGFDVDYPGGSGVWGRINLATGAFSQVGNLNTYFPAIDGDHTEQNGFSLAFGPSGALYVTGCDSDANFDYGTLNLTTGAFTKIAASPVFYAGSLATPTPEPSTLTLLGASAIGMLVYGWRRRR